MFTTKPRNLEISDEGDRVQTMLLIPKYPLMRQNLQMRPVSVWEKFLAWLIG